jgi:hypothetical protein
MDVKFSAAWASAHLATVLIGIEHGIANVVPKRWIAWPIIENFQDQFVTVTEFGCRVVEFFELWFLGDGVGKVPSCDFLRLNDLVVDNEPTHDL